MRSGRPVTPSRKRRLIPSGRDVASNMPAGARALAAMSSRKSRRYHTRLCVKRCRIRLPAAPASELCRLTALRSLRAPPTTWPVSTRCAAVFTRSKASVVCRAPSVPARYPACCCRDVSASRGVQGAKLLKYSTLSFHPLPPFLLPPSGYQLPPTHRPYLPVYLSPYLPSSGNPPFLPSSLPPPVPLFSIILYPFLHLSLSMFQIQIKFSSTDFSSQASLSSCMHYLSVRTLYHPFLPTT